MFVTLQGVDWVRWNLEHEAGQEYTRRIPWSTLFGYLCWDIWVSRCKRLFDGTDGRGLLSGKNTFFRAAWDQDLVKSCKFYHDETLPPIVGNQDKNGCVILEVDGLVLTNGDSSCGGVIKDEDGRWIVGFRCKLVPVPPAMAELLGVMHGLQLCWERGYRKILLRSDCVSVLNLLSRGCEGDHPFNDIILDARMMMYRDWQVHLTFMDREQNNIADLLAKSAHRDERIFCLFDQQPPFIQEAGADDLG
ncbi:uncharacterized protein LOC114741452 [Neltuma alba]|uniref:uncharacterized protein LOC114741452 n=1 Tax=Neltuma alba TaxID=207710 RepID=UPI0010A33CC8|nr:uncharacterized protein LOC114741452 [Prosopis alba]